MQVVRVVTVLLAGFGILASGVLEAAEWHVSPEGQDSADGSAGSPFRTIQRGLKSAGPGDTVILYNGVYRETIRPLRSGKAGKPIIITNAPGQSPIITAMDEIKGPWKDEGNGIFSTGTSPVKALYDGGKFTSGTGAASSGLDQVYLNGTMLVEARYPNKVSADLLEHNGAAVVLDETYECFSAAWKSFPADHFKGARFLGRIYPNWSSQSGVVVSSSGDSIRIDPDSVSVPWWPNRSNKLSSDGSAFLYGTLNLLDADGEWHLERSGDQGETLYLRAPGGANPGDFRIERKARPWCVQIEGRQHIVVRGLQIRGGAVLLNGNNLVLENCYIRNPTHFQTFANGYSSNGGLQNGSGVLVEGNGNSVRNCMVLDSAGTGIRIQGAGHLVSRNMVRNADYSGTYGAAISISGTGSLLDFNTLQDTGRDVIAISGSGHGIFYNHLRRAGRLALDVGLIYSYGQDGAGATGQPTRIAYNWLHESGNPEDTRTRGIYLDNYSRNFVVDHNVVWDLGPADANRGLHINAPAQGIAFYHNTLIGVQPASNQTYSKFPVGISDKEFWTERNNHLIYIHQNNLHIPSSTAPESVLEDPANGDYRPLAEFADPGETTFTIEWETRDGKTGVPEGYRLLLQEKNLVFSYKKTGGSGVRVAGINDTFTGPAPDNGAYERGQPLWKPGHDGWRMGEGPTDPRKSP